MNTHTIEMYRALRERLRSASLRGHDTDIVQAEVDAMWRMLSEADRRFVLGVGEGKTAA